MHRRSASTTGAPLTWAWASKREAVRNDISRGIRTKSRLITSAAVRSWKGLVATAMARLLLKSSEMYAPKRSNRCACRGFRDQNRPGTRLYLKDLAFGGPAVDGAGVRKCTLCARANAMQSIKPQWRMELRRLRHSRCNPFLPGELSTTAANE